MKRLAIVIITVLALLLGMRIFAVASFGGANVIYGLENAFFGPLSFTTGLPGPVLWIIFIVLMVKVFRWAFGERDRNFRHSEQQALSSAPSESDPDMEQLARDLEHTARNLEKRLEALETILLDRTETRL